MESSLTTPEDRDIINKWLPNSGLPVLNDSETILAMEDLNITSFVERFPRRERVYCDPILPMQNIGLVSFIPAKGATPNSNGIFGFAKIRGTFNTEVEANTRAEYIIRNVDSYHQIFHTYVGRPFPLTVSSRYSAETSEIDVRNQTAESVDNSVSNKRKEELEVVQEIKKREEELIQDTKKATADPEDLYTTLKVKKAQITWTYLETMKKIEEMRNIIIKTRDELVVMDSEHPTFQEIYLKKYMDAREKSGLSSDHQQSHDNFMKFLVEDVDLGF